MGTTESDLLKELRRITRLLVAGAVAGKRQKEQIQLLSSAGFEPREIAEFLGTSSNAVRVALSGLRKEKKSLARKD